MATTTTTTMTTAVVAEDDLAQRLFAHVDQNQHYYIAQLTEAVGIPSVSADLSTHLPDICRMMEWTQKHIERLGGTCQLVPNLASTNAQPLPPILLAEFQAVPPEQHDNFAAAASESAATSNPRKTVCIYGHLDVQPAQKDDGWDSDPFVLTERDGKLYGRGSTDDKGPALSWLWVIETYQQLSIPLPVNVKLMYEGMEESGSIGLFECIHSIACRDFLRDVDFFCISDNYWLGRDKPCLTYGLRGLAYFHITVQCSEQDLHSGVYGGNVHEAMTDLIHMMGTLIDSATGQILIPGIMDDVKPLTEQEDTLYDTILFDTEAYKDDITVRSVSNRVRNEGNKKAILMARWRYPSLSLHGIQGAFSGPGDKTVIPAQVTGKFSIRLVPDQEPDKVAAIVKKHLEKQFAKLKSPNRFQVTMTKGAGAWLSSPDHPNYAAAAAAIRCVYKGQDPDFTREGGSIPVANMLEEATGGTSVLLLPIGACDDMAHSQNEKYNVSNLMNGIKVLAMYLYELGQIKGPKPSDCRCVALTPDELNMPGAFIKGFRCKCEI